MKKILCIFMALICTVLSFTATANEISNISLNNNTLVVEGSVEYADGVDKAHVFVLKEGKTLKDLFTAEDSNTVMDYVDDIFVSENSKNYSLTIDTDGVTDNTKVIVAYNGDITETLVKEHIYYDGCNVYLSDNVTYSEGADTVTVSVLSADKSETLYSNTVSVNKSNGAFSVYFTGEKEVSDKNFVKISYNNVDTERTVKKSEIIKVVSWSANCYAEANDLIAKGYSVMINLPEGKMNPMEIKNSVLSSKDNAVVIFKGNNTTISSRTAVPYTAFEKVTNSEILDRVSDKAKDSLYMINLEEAGLGGASVTAENITRTGTEFYLNNKRQQLSKYPNTGYKVLSGVENSTTGEVTTQTYNYGDAPVDKWRGSTSAIVEGYISCDWLIEASEVNPSTAENGKLAFTKPITYTASDGGKIVYRNLLEEIDLPGEWCINDQIMYYYMPEGVSEADTFELAISNTPALTLDSTAKNLWFDGITFEGSTAKAVDMTNVNNVKFTNNVFENGNIGLYGSGDNVTVENNEFLNFKDHAVKYVGGGSSDTYTKSNTKISNNYFYNNSNENHNPAVLINGGNNLNVVGVEFSNNIVHGNVLGYGIRYEGIDIEISNNEFYNLIRYGADAGVIYSGRSFTQFGNVVKNNYIHDFGPVVKDFIKGYTVHGIYMDDWMSGQSILGNLIVPNNSVNKSMLNGMVTFGAYTTAIGNVTVGANKGISFYDRPKTSLEDISGAYNSFNYLNGKDTYLAKYPQITALKADIDKNSEFTMIYNTATDNIGYDLNKYNAHYNAFGTDANSTTDGGDHEVDSTVFVDAANGDYRVKSSALKGADYESEYTPTENTVFGFKRAQSKNSFKTLYPVNGSELASGTSSVPLYWEQALYADSYEYQIATDNSFNNIVKKGTTTERLIDVEGLKAGTYYVRIKAINESDIAGYSWYSDVTSFTVGESATEKPEYSVSGQSISVNDKVATVTYTFENNKEATGKYTLLVAAYDGNTMKNVKTVELDKATKDVSKEINFDVSLTGLTLKAFIWSDISSMVPLTGPIQ